MNDTGNLAGQLAALSARVAGLEAQSAIRRLHHAYGYFMDYCWYDEVIQLFSDDGEAVFLYHVPPAHTDGDTFVQFVHANVIMTGDFFRSIQYPNIDRTNGGSLPGLIAALDAVIKTAGALCAWAPVRTNGLQGCML